ncbi:hypothetical protein Tco_0343314 [Tanacetum coccineum]
MVLIKELEVLIVELFMNLFVGLFVVVFVEENWSHRADGKDSFIKCDMSRNDNFVGVQVKTSISEMIVRVPEKDIWCGTRGKFVRWNGVRVEGRILKTEDVQRHDTSVEFFVYYKTQGHVTTLCELQRHQGGQEVDAKGNGYYQSQPLKILGKGEGLPTWLLYNWEGGSRVDEMILARKRSGFAVEKVWGDIPVVTGF